MRKNKFYKKYISSLKNNLFIWGCGRGFPRFFIQEYGFKLPNSSDDNGNEILRYGDWVDKQCNPTIMNYVSQDHEFQKEHNHLYSSDLSDCIYADWWISQTDFTKPPGSMKIAHPFVKLNFIDASTAKQYLHSKMNYEMKQKLKNLIGVKSDYQVVESSLKDVSDYNGQKEIYNQIYAMIIRELSSQVKFDLDNIVFPEGMIYIPRKNKFFSIESTMIFSSTKPLEKIHCLSFTNDIYDLLSRSENFRVKYNNVFKIMKEKYSEIIESEYKNYSM